MLLPGVEHSRERINGCHARNAKPFCRIEHSVAVSEKCKQMPSFSSYILNFLACV